MAEAGILARSEQRVLISDTYLENNRNVTGAGADIDLLTLTPVAAFVGLNNSAARGIPRSGVNAAYNPRAVSINGNTDGVQNGNSGIINGQAANDPYFMDELIAAEHLHRVCLRAIRPRGTTARDIIIHS